MTGTGGGGGISGVIDRGGGSVRAEHKLRILPRDTLCAPADFGRSARLSSNSFRLLLLVLDPLNFTPVSQRALSVPALALAIGMANFSDDFSAAFSALITV